MIPIILAAGQSRRFGTQKLNLAYKGKPLLQWVIDVVRENFSNGIAVISESVDLSKIDLKNLKKIVNRHSELGLSSSIKLAINAVNNEDILIFLGDMPEIDSALVRKITELAKESIVFPNFNGVKGFPVYVPARYLKKACEIEGDKGLKDLIMSNGYITFEWTKSCIFDVDLPKDLEGIDESE